MHCKNEDYSALFRTNPEEWVGCRLSLRAANPFIRMGNTLTQLVFQPPEITYIHARKNLIWLHTKKAVKIPAFYLDRRSSVTVLFSHGNAEDLGMIFEHCVEFTKVMNVNLLAYDYEGYGKAGGVPSESNCYEDIDAAYTYLINILHQNPQNIVLYGRSLGSGPSCYLAERLSKSGIRLGGLVLQSSLLSVYRVAFNFRFTLPGDMFPNVDRIANICCPLLVIHGTRDEIVPFWNGESLFLEAPIQWRARCSRVIPHKRGPNKNIAHSSVYHASYFSFF